MIRAFQWDLARQVERLDWLLQQLPRYADWGYQELYLHLEDAVEYPRLPEVARADAYRHRDLALLAERAAQVGIGVVPIVNLLGHTQYLIKTEALRDLNELRHPDGSPREKGQLCPLHPRTLEVAAALLDDVLPFCTAGKVHLGLDESFHLGQHPASRKEIAEIGLAAHFAGYVGRLHKIATEHKLKVGMWADMLALLPEAIPLLPSGIAAYDWYYYPFRTLPRMELYNFRDYDLAPALRAQGIDYWGCPMNGAFRYEPLPIFGERLQNLHSWWSRCQKVGAAGFLVTSWEAYRLAMPSTLLVDAAAASLWLNPEADDGHLRLDQGFARLHPEAPPRTRARWTRQMLACDEHPFSGYARWEIHDRWDGISTRENFSRFLTEARFFRRLEKDNPPPDLAPSIAFRRYLAERDVWVRSAARGVWKLRRLLHAQRATQYQEHLRSLIEEANDFALRLTAGIVAAAAMWAQSRDRQRQGQNTRLLRRDRQRLTRWQRWLERVQLRPHLAQKPCLVAGAWQLQLLVHLHAPALQKVVAEQEQPDGTWRELGSRFTIEFRAEAARPRTHIRRELAFPVDAPETRFRLSIRGLGQVMLSQIELTDGRTTLPAQLPHPSQRKLLLGRPAPTAGFPEIDWTKTSESLEFTFATSEQNLR